jgi:malonate-semialdehyde dehydrogenase (acetylating)/methylmalonate-semialdehyde dehydrogenase
MGFLVENFINGRVMPSKTERFGNIFDPSTGKVIGQTPLSTQEDAESAISAAAKAYPGWAATPASKRVQVMFRFREALMQNLVDLAQLLSREHGKTLSDAKGEIARGIEVVEFACGIPHLLKGEYSEAVASGVDSHSVRQPLGVCAGITPFNFPAMVPLWMYPIAIACGNTFVLKPSEKDPSVPVRIAQIFHECGLPDGVFNVLNGDKQMVDALLTDPRIQSISFVGSTAVGKYIYTKGCENEKRVQALCGAKNHMVVMPDANMDQVVDALIGSAFGSAGERCMAVSVALPIGDATADALIERLVPRIRSLRVAPYTDPESELGPVISKESHQRILGYIQQGLDSGAKLVVDGRGVNLQGYEGGYFIGGCLFDKVTKDMSIYKEEIFGPVLSVLRAKSFDEAVGLIDDHPYGNGTAIFTRDGDAAREFASRVRIGMVGVNVPIPVPVAYHSFGGWKRSLFGDHHIHGTEGLRFFTRLKTMTTRWPSGIREGAEFNFTRGSDV